MTKVKEQNPEYKDTPVICFVNGFLMEKKTK